MVIFVNFLTCACFVNQRVVLLRVSLAILVFVALMCLPTLFFFHISSIEPILHAVVVHDMFSIIVGQVQNIL
jgi:hypothetical protein